MSAEISEELVATHWGNFRVAAKNGMPVAVWPFEGDDNPAGFGASLLDALDGNVRIPQPMIRAGWLSERAGSGLGRGLEPFVPLPWDRPR